MASEEKSSWMKNLTLLSVAVRFLSLVEKLLPVFFSSWNDYLRQQNANLKAEVDLLQTKKRINDRIKKANLGKTDLEIINEYVESIQNKKGGKDE